MKDLCAYLGTRVCTIGRRMLVKYHKILLRRYHRAVLFVSVPDKTDVSIKNEIDYTSNETAKDLTINSNLEKTKITQLQKTMQ